MCGALIHSNTRLWMGQEYQQNAGLWPISKDWLVIDRGDRIGGMHEPRGRQWSAIADHRKEELFHPGSALDLSARHGAGHRGDVIGERGRVIMMPVVFFAPVLFVFSTAVLVLALF